MQHSLKDELLCEDRVLPLSWVRLGYLNTVQVDVTVRIGEVLHWQLVGLLYIQHQAAHLGEKTQRAQQWGRCWGILGQGWLIFFLLTTQ